VFATPGQDDAEVVEGPAGAPTEAELATLVGRAEAAARAGRVKQTLVIDARTRVRVDARYGRAKVQTIEEATFAKMMGGKDRPLRPDVSGALLRTIGIANADGSISTRHARKYKQVNHFVELCRPTLERLRGERLRIFDLACGNGYLTFVLAEALRLQDRAAEIHGIDLREDLIERCRARASELGWSHLRFEVGAIRDADLGEHPDLVLALHACDTATDEALAKAILAGAEAIFVAPCCQRELATQLDARVVPTPALADVGLLRRDYAATLTDALRVEILEACGYTVDALEFVTSDHTPKNLLLRAHRHHPRGSLDAIADRCHDLGISPTLLALLA
jgi:SAM-dependent methyltransferase